MKGNFAPINRIPGEVLSLIPTYWARQDPHLDKYLIALTHVCRAWRALFISYPSLWGRLDFRNVKKTRNFIERSKSSPLRVILCANGRGRYPKDAFLLAVPHLRRLQSVVFVGTSDLLRHFSKHLTSPAPVLKELVMALSGSPPVIDGTFFNGDLSSLDVLILAGVITHLPWKNLPHLTEFELSSPPTCGITVVHLLNFLEGAPRLREITIILTGSTPGSSNVPSRPMVHLPCLKKFELSANPVHSTILDYLTIPEGASLVLEFDFIGNESPLPHYLPKTAENLKNLTLITTVNLYFDEKTKLIRLNGPSGGLRISGCRRDWGGVTQSDLDCRILQSLDYFSLCTTRRLAIMKYKPPLRSKPGNSPLYKTLLRMTHLLTLTLTQCDNLRFIRALNPARNPSKLTLCPALEELTLYIEKPNALNVPELVDMVKERAARGTTQLRSITVVGLRELVSGKEVFELREHVGHVEYRLEAKPPEWDSVPGDEGG